MLDTEPAANVGGGATVACTVIDPCPPPPSCFGNVVVAVAVNGAAGEATGGFTVTGPSAFVMIVTSIAALPPAHTGPKSTAAGFAPSEPINVFPTIGTLSGVVPAVNVIEPSEPLMSSALGSYLMVTLSVKPGAIDIVPGVLGVYEIRGGAPEKPNALTLNDVVLLFVIVTVLVIALPCSRFVPKSIGYGEMPTCNAMPVQSTVTGRSIPPSPDGVVK